MKIDILTLFPEMFAGPFSESMIKRAQQKNIIEITIHNIRDWATDKHHMVDDKPYGGGAGMVLRIEPIDNALRDLRSRNKSHTDSIKKSSHVVLLSPQGTVYNQHTALELSTYEHLLLIAGHYEGFDERIREHLIDEEISIGNYVLTGGELPAMVIADSIVRLIPGVLGAEDSLKDETHTKLDLSKNTTNKKYPMYTRPSSYKGWEVPEVLLSGNHAQITEWKRKNMR